MLGQPGAPIDTTGWTAEQKFEVDPIYNEGDLFWRVTNADGTHMGSTSDATTEAEAIAEVREDFRVHAVFCRDASGRR